MENYTLASKVGAFVGYLIWIGIACFVILLVGIIL